MPIHQRGRCTRDDRLLSKHSMGEGFVGGDDTDTAAYLSIREDFEEGSDDKSTRQTTLQKKSNKNWSAHQRNTQEESEELILVGRVLGVHGLRGLLKVHSFTSPGEALFSYTSLFEKEGTPFPRFDLGSVSRRGTYQNAPFFLARPACVHSRSSAETFLHKKIYIKKNALPPLEAEEIYLHDLKEKRAQDTRGHTYGVVKSVKNFGAGDLLEIELTPEAHTHHEQTTQKSDDKSTRQAKLRKKPTVFVRFHDSCVADITENTITLTNQGVQELLV